MPDKRKRSHKFSTEEKQRLVNLLFKYQDKIFATPGGSRSEANTIAWYELTNLFNSDAASTIYRNKDLLKKLWEKLKADSRSYEQSGTSLINRPAEGEIDPILVQVSTLLRLIRSERAVVRSRASAAPQATQALQGPQAPQAPQARQAPQAPQAPHAPQASQAPQALQTLQAAPALHAQQVPEVQQVSQVAQAPPQINNSPRGSTSTGQLVSKNWAMVFGVEQATAFGFNMGTALPEGPTLAATGTTWPWEQRTNRRRGITSSHHRPRATTTSTIVTSLKTETDSRRSLSEKELVYIRKLKILQLRATKRSIAMKTAILNLLDDVIDYILKPGRDEDDDDDDEQLLY